jgi:glyoxylase I family protein
MFRQGVLLFSCVLLSAVALTTHADNRTVGDTVAVRQAKPDDASNDKKAPFRAGAIRYQVKDVDRAVAFYTQHLGFKKGQQFPGAPFAAVSNGNLTLWLSGPGSSGSRPMPDGRSQAPGGWNRLVLEVDDLPALVTTMKKAGLRFRNEIESGPGGKQIQLEDPDGNPVELFQPAAPPP